MHSSDAKLYLEMAFFQDLQNTAEEAVSKYEYNDNLSLRKVNFTNVNEMEDLANLTKYSEHFKQHVYLETSGVHVPIEIYEGCE